MNIRSFLGAGVTAGLLLLCSPFIAPVHAADELNIDHVQVSEDGTVSVLLAVDGIPAGTPPDLDGVSVTVDDVPVDASAEPVQAGEIKRTTVLALDASRSMTGERFLAAKAAAKAFLKAAPDDVAVGLLTFSGEVHDVTQPTTDHAALADRIDQIELTFGTHVYDAVVQSVKLAGAEGARSVLVLSDGEDQGDGTSLQEAVQVATDGGVVVDVVAIQQTARNRSLLAQISDASGGRIIPADDAAALEALFTAQAEAFASQLVVKFRQPEQVSDEASIAISVPAGDQTYNDSAFVTLAASTPDAGLEVVEPEEPIIGERGLWIGGTALGLGLAGILAVVLVGSSRQPSLAERQMAHYSSARTGPAGGVVQTATPSTSLRDSAVAVTQKVVKGDFETRLSQRLAGAGLALTAAEWLLLHAGIAVASAFVGLVLRGPALMVVLFAAGAGLPWMYLKFKHGRRLAAFNAQLAETLQLIAGGLSAGLSLPQAIDTVVREGQEPMAGELRRALIEQRLGIEIEATLDGVAERMSSKDFSWVVMAIRIQREVGGNLAELLNTVSDTLRERDYLRRQVRVLSAEGRFSAWILGGLPIAMFIFMVVFRTEVVTPMFTDPLGLLLLLTAVVLLVGGFFTMSRLVKVEV